jgi:SAM-dependent methyltransferase
VELSAEQIERALAAADVANQALGDPQALAPSPPTMAPMDDDTPPAGMAAMRLGPPQTPPPSAADFGHFDIPEPSEDSLDDIVNELVKDDRKDSARRRAQQRRTQLPWWQEIFDAAFLDLSPPRPTRAIEAESVLFARLLQLNAGARVLDVACGEGRHSIELAKLGCEVVGYDLSRDMVAAAERNARSAGVEITFVVDDMRAPEKVGGDFDAVMCVGTSFGYFDDGTNVETLAKMRDALRNKRGPLLIHGFNRDHAAAKLPERSLWRVGEHIISEEADFDALTSRLRVHKQVVYADGEVREWPISIRLYAAHELRNLMRALEATATRVAGPPRYSGRYLGAMCRDLLVLGLWG